MTRPQALVLAQQMWEDGEGWSLTEIQRCLARHGVNVARQTVHAWVDPEWCERERARQRRDKRRHRGTRQFRVLDADAQNRLGQFTEPTPELLLALRSEDHLSYGAIAAVVRRLFGGTVTEDEMRFRLYELGAPKNPNKARRAAA